MCKKRSRYCINLKIKVTGIRVETRERSVYVTSSFTIPNSGKSCFHHLLKKNCNDNKTHVLSTRKGIKKNVCSTYKNYSLTLWAYCTKIFKNQ